ncbi:hypothetical protein HDU84_007104 [Entophlyctis sp. JEL0112]|nr:hypothetical protein HDU84_007104 [Entophlyctis sp. JEL0112]
MSNTNSKTSTHYYLNLFCVSGKSNGTAIPPALSWVSPPIDPADMSKMSVGKSEIVIQPKRRTSLSTSQRLDYLSLGIAEKNRLLFGEPSQHSATRRNSAQRPTTDSESEMDMGNLKKRSQNSFLARKKRLSASLDGSKPNYKLFPPFTDLLVTDPLPFVADNNDPSRNSLLVPEGSFYHVQDDRCMNKKKYMDFPKCRSCIWKHRERLPYCFFVGFRAFLVKLDDGSTSISNSKQEEARVGGLPLISNSTSRCRLMNDVPGENLVYGPYFIPNGVSIPGTITATGPSIQLSSTSTKRKLKNAEDQGSPLINDDDEEIMIRPPKRKYVRRPKSLPNFPNDAGESSPFENAQQFSTPIASVTSASTFPITRAATGTPKSLPQQYKIAKSKVSSDSGDFPDLVASAAFPFVPKPDAPHLNALIIPADRPFHIQDDKCLNKRYLDFPKCRSCRWKHKERLPHCFYVGFRVFGVRVDYLVGSSEHGRNRSPMDLEVVGKIPADSLIYGPYFLPRDSDANGAASSSHAAANEVTQGREGTAESSASELKEPSVVSESVDSSKVLSSGDEKDLTRSSQEDFASTIAKEMWKIPHDCGNRSISDTIDIMDVDSALDAGQSSGFLNGMVRVPKACLELVESDVKKTVSIGETGNDRTIDSQNLMEVDARPAPLENVGNSTHEIANTANGIDVVEERIFDSEMIDEHVNAGEEGLMMLAAVARVDAHVITPPQTIHGEQQEVTGLLWKESPKPKNLQQLSDETMTHASKISSKFSSGFKLSQIYGNGKSRAASGAGAEKLLVLPPTTVPDSSALPKAAVGSATTPCDS